MDAAAIRAATELWPLEPDDDDDPEPSSRPPVVPPGSWFERN